KRVEAEGRERSTIDQYKQHANLHIIPRIGKSRLANLETAVECCLEDLLANLSRAMAHKVMVSFHQMLKANKYGHIAQDIKIKMSKRDKRKLEVGRDIPTTTEIKRMIVATTNIRTKTLLLLASFTGLR